MGLWPRHQYEVSLIFPMDPLPSPVPWNNRHPSVGPFQPGGTLRRRFVVAARPRDPKLPFTAHRDAEEDGQNAAPRWRLQWEARPCQVQTRERKQALISAPSCSKKQTRFDLRLSRLEPCLFLSARALRGADRPAGVVTVVTPVLPEVRAACGCFGWYLVILWAGPQPSAVPLPWF